MKILANRAICMGSGQCVNAAPEIFEQDADEGLVVVLKPEVGEDLREAAELAAMSCPVHAVTLTG